MPAACMPQFSGKVAKARAAQLRALGEQQYSRFCESRLGAVESVLVERDGLGRTEQFVPIAVPGHGPGELVTVRAVATSADGLVGEPIRTAACWPTRSQASSAASKATRRLNR